MKYFVDDKEYTRGDFAYTLDQVMATVISTSNLESLSFIVYGKLQVEDENKSRIKGPDWPVMLLTTLFPFDELSTMPKDSKEDPASGHIDDNSKLVKF